MAASPSKLSRWIPRFSLRTLLIVTVLIGSAATLWWRWEPWVNEHTMQHNDMVLFASFCLNDTHVCSASLDGTIRIWNTITGKQVHLLSQEGQVGIVDMSGDGKRLVAASWASSEEPHVWNLESGTEITRLHHNARNVTFSPDGMLIVTASGSTDSYANVFDAWTGKRIVKIGFADEMIGEAAISPDNRTVATAYNSSALFDVTTGKLIFTLSPVGGGTDSIMFSHNGKLVAAVCKDRTVRLFDSKTGLSLTGFSHAGFVKGWFSKDDSRLLTSSGDGSARLWDVHTGQQLLLLHKNNKPLQYAAFSPTEEFIVTASRDKTAVVWDARDGTEVFQLIGHTDGVLQAVFSADGQRIVTASRDHTVRVWRRRRPEYWWGAAWLPEFWLTVAFSFGLIWSVWRDRRGR